MKQRKGKKGRIVLIVLAVLLALLAALAYWQRNNIKALLNFTTYSQEELEEQLKQNDQQIKDVVDALEEVTVRDLTDEERQALRDGTLTPEELTSSLMGNAPSVPTQPDVPEQPEPDPQQPPVSAQPSDPASSSQQTPVEPAPENSEYQQKLSALVARVYVLREEYIIALDNLQAEAIADYKTLSASQRKGSKLAEFVSKYLSRGTQLEKDCDRKMDAIVLEMKTLIKEYNGDLSLVDTVIMTYANEKSLKKAWYMSELEKRGFI